MRDMQKASHSWVLSVGQAPCGMRLILRLPPLLLVWLVLMLLVVRPTASMVFVFFPAAAALCL